jgi:hypothetical protein
MSLVLEGKRLIVQTGTGNSAVHGLNRTAGEHLASRFVISEVTNGTFSLDVGVERGSRASSHSQWPVSLHMELCPVNTTIQLDLRLFRHDFLTFCCAMVEYTLGGASAACYLSVWVDIVCA